MVVFLRTKYQLLDNDKIRVDIKIKGKTTGRKNQKTQHEKN